MKSPVALYSCLFDDVKRQEHCVKGLDRDLETIEFRFENEGIGFISVALPALCNALDRGLADGRFDCPSHFSRRRGSALPKFLWGLLSNVFEPSTGLLLEHPHVNAVKHLREILMCFKKVLVEPKRQRKLTSEALRDFEETDASVLQSYPKDRVDILERVCRYFMPNLDGFDMESLTYKHGPGGVYERVGANRKWVILDEHFSRDMSISDRIGYSGFYASSWLDHQNGSSDDLPLFTYASRRGMARLVMVPKSSTALRTITVEPVLKQFVQQGLNTYLRDSILQCSVLSQSLSLTDQSKNQNLALIGSRTGEYSTLDLSSASDLLGINLVKLVFGSKPLFLKAALDCRSEFVEANKPLLIRKFAGMGNALTFPVQSIVFTAIAISAILWQRGEYPSYSRVKRAASITRVYGDDIIVGTEYSRSVIEWIESFGLKVNQKKTFTTGNFRESCGTDAFKGHVVTPVYVRHLPFCSDRNPDTIASLVSASNQFWLNGCYNAAKFLEQAVSRVMRLPLVSMNSGAVGWISRVDATEAHSWDRNAQQLVVRAPVIRGVFDKSDSISGIPALMKSLSNLESRRQPQAPVSIDPLHLYRSVKRFKTRISYRRVPARAG